jgi:DNA-binding MarR family transcriptional regulator
MHLDPAADPLPLPIADHAVLDAVRRLVQMVHLTSRTAERSVGVSGAQLFVLQTLARHGPLTPAALAEHTRTHQSSVSVVIRRLVEHGLASRTPSPTDRRSVEVTASPAGHSLLREAPPTPADCLLAGLAHLPDAQRRTLARDLGDLVRAMGLDQGPAPLFLSTPPHPG